MGADGRPDPGPIGDAGLDRADNRMFVEAVLWIVRTAAPWRDLPGTFGLWNTVFRRFSRWSAKGVWHRIFAAMADDLEFDYLIVDSTIVRVHQHAAGGKGGFASGHWPLAWRPDQQAPPCRRWPGLSEPDHLDRRTGRRCAPGRSLGRAAEGKGRDRRYRL